MGVGVVHGEPFEGWVRRSAMGDQSLRRFPLRRPAAHPIHSEAQVAECAEVGKGPNDGQPENRGHRPVLGEQDIQRQHRAENGMADGQ